MKKKVKINNNQFVTRLNPILVFILPFTTLFKNQIIHLHESNYHYKKLGLIIVGLLIIQFSGVIDFIPTSAQVSVPLLAYFQFDGTLRDSSGNGNHGVFSGTNEQYSTGVFSSQSLLVNEGEYVVLENENNFDFESNQPFSVTFWVNNSQETNHPAVISKASPFWQGWKISLCDFDCDGIHFYMRGLTNTKLLEVYSDGVLNDGQWNHVAVVYDGSKLASGLKIYINNVETIPTIIQDTLGQSSILNDSPMVISGTMSQAMYSGQLDDLRIYSGALVPADVTEIFSSSVPHVTSLDLSLSSEVDNVMVNELDNVEFTLDVTNNGDIAAASVLVQGNFESGFVYVSDDSGGAFNSVTGDWNVGSLSIGQTKTLKITAQIESGTADNTIAFYSSVVSSSPVDPTPSNDSTSSGVYVNIPSIDQVTGFRSTSYGDYTQWGHDQSDPAYWTSVAQQMSAKFPNSVPGGVLVVGTVDGDPSSATSTFMPFPAPAGSYPNVTFGTNDDLEPLLDAYDAAGLKIYLQVEPADADVSMLMDLVMNQYQHHSSVIGFGVDVYTFKHIQNPGTGTALTDSEVNTWATQVQTFDPTYELVLTHWDSSYLSNARPDNAMFVTNTAYTSSLSEKTNEYISWIDSFGTSKTGFLIGDPSEMSWWNPLTDPASEIMSPVITARPNANIGGIFWVDISVLEEFPDNGTPSITINDVTQAEGDSGTNNFVFTVTRSVNTPAISVQYQTADNTATAPSDYTSLSLATLNFASGGPLTQTITVPVNGDVTEESTEEFYVNLSNCTGCTITDSQGVGTISNDDGSSQVDQVAGFRSTSYGDYTQWGHDQSDPAYWTSVAQQMSAKFPNSTPGGVLVVGTVDGDPSSATNTFMPFPAPAGSYPNVTFGTNDDLEPLLDAYDAAGLKIYLQVEPADADVSMLMDLVMNQYQHHSSVIGFGVDVYTFKHIQNPGTGTALTDSEVNTWATQVQTFDPDYELVLTHWDSSYLSNARPDNAMFVTNTAYMSSLSEATGEYISWVDSFGTSKVGFNIGDPSDMFWWNPLTDPASEMIDPVIAARPNAEIGGIFWVDISVLEEFPDT
ncbi:MAG: hypothetical protein OEL77_02845 [Nitrosopumilus sp.]|nr:hypothetical protein [Nitrosopumilus sp.]MDH3384932.1 hypothetical protein [Nitrosopumilus sp.]